MDKEKLRNKIIPAGKQSGVRIQYLAVDNNLQKTCNEEEIASFIIIFIRVQKDDN